MLLNCSIFLGDPCRGDVYLTRGVDGVERSALTVVTDYDGVVATVALCSPDVEFGSSSDVVLPAGESFGYALLLQSDIYGYVWDDQLSAKVGTVPLNVYSVFDGLRRGECDAVDVAGPPIVRKSDPRWKFKRDELERLNVLKESCTNYLVGRHSVKVEV